jgi:protein SCO1/2
MKCPTTLVRVALAWALVACAAGRSALAQSGLTKLNIVPNSVVEKIGVDQKLGAPVPLDLEFRDESGRTVRLGQYFTTGKPVVLSLVYYRCPGLCTMTLNSMSAAFKPLTLSVGKDFEVVTVSIDPKETPKLAAAKKAEYLKRYGRPGAEAGWHFLTGDGASIEALAAAVGFRYVYQPEIDQYAHAAAIMVATPQGKLARYFYGIEYSARDLRLGLVEASGNRIGTLADVMTLLCYQYDPKSGKYGTAVMRIVRAGGVATVLGLGAFIVLTLRRERRAVGVAAPSRGPAHDTGAGAGRA